MSLLPVQLAEDMEEIRVVNYQGTTKWNDEGYELQFQNLQVLGRPWKYRGEGNSNIVVALQDDMRVVRLSKVKTGESDPEDWASERRKIEREVLFANNTFGPILGREFVGSVRLFKLSLTEIKELNECLRSLRPANRLHKELGIPYATSHTDFARIHSYSAAQALSPNFCVEIKAKQGWWTKSVKSSLCTFCLNQFLKLKSGKIGSRTNYCPLHLFSGNPRLMIRSVIALLDNPQNNFRIFRDGVLVYGDNLVESLEPVLREWISSCDTRSANINSESQNHSESMRSELENMVYLICTALLTPQLLLNGAEARALLLFEDLRRELAQLLSDFTVPAGRVLKDPACGNHPARPLPEGSILSRILYAQKLGKWGAGSIYNLFRKVCPYHHSLIPPDPDPDCPGRKCLGVEKWLDELEVGQAETTELEVLCIEHYLLAATAKDCSIMITFSPVNREERRKRRRLSRAGSGPDTAHIMEDLKGSAYRVRVGVADLDPKPVTSIARHYFRDLDMVQAYRALEEELASTAECDD